MPIARPLGSSSIPLAPATAPSPINSVQNSRQHPARCALVCFVLCTCPAICFILILLTSVSCPVQGRGPRPGSVHSPAHRLSAEGGCASSRPPLYCTGSSLLHIGDFCIRMCPFYRYSRINPYSRVRSVPSPAGRHPVFICRAAVRHAKRQGGSSLAGSFSDQTDHGFAPDRPEAKHVPFSQRRSIQLQLIRLPPCAVPDSGTPDAGTPDIPCRMRWSDNAPPAESADAA